jgi:hypothetical protein
LVLCLSRPKENEKKVWIMHANIWVHTSGIQESIKHKEGKTQDNSRSVAFFSAEITADHCFRGEMLASTSSRNSEQSLDGEYFSSRPIKLLVAV